MATQLSRFRVEGLHNKYTFDIPIKDNKLVLIGENGIGKSTVANFMYFFLTNQWDRMLAYEFKSVSAEIDGKEVEYTREELLKITNKKIPFSTEKFIAFESDTFDDDAEQFFTKRLLKLFSELEYAELSELSKRLEEIVKGRQVAKFSFNDKILYLPTYRRIEQDLASIFPEWVNSPDFKKDMESWKRRAQSKKHVELVQFGMKDVEDNIKRKMSEIENGWREGLDTLMGSYLRDAINGKFTDSEFLEFRHLDEKTLDEIFQRIDQSVLPQSQQNMLRDVVKLVQSNKELADKDKVAAHLLALFIEFHRNQQPKEEDIRKFVEVCNSYFVDKKFIYDNTKFEISIHLQDMKNIPVEGDTNILKMSMLSSGEKQMVSLFSQLYLSGDPNYFVIIDEPELSLSLTWQKHFLPDILNSGHCSGLIAITHSPFICDNELDSSMRSLRQFMEPWHAVH